MRVREGDEASCLNLNRALTPRLLGLQPSALSELKAFTFAAKAGDVGKDNPWLALNRVEGDIVPGIADANTIEWSLQMGLGGVINYVDEHGRPFRVKLVASLAGSILQGAVIISEDAFVERFPSQSGYQAYLIDNPAGASGHVENAELAKNLGRALEDVGLDLTPATERLAAFSTVENTYLSIFAVLGGLGLLLGSLGLGVVVLRHVLERRAELALLRAVGFRNGALQWLVFSEHSLLLALGLLLGVGAALVAVAPSLTSPGAEVPWMSLVITLGMVFVSGFLFTWLATAAALRSPLMSALRNE
jgi:putative ABC transport system permease protein